MYPAEYVQEVRLAVAFVVLVSWVGAFVLWRRRRGQARASAEVGTGDTQAIDADRSGRTATV